MYKTHTHCRACDSTDLIPVFDLGLQPLANSFKLISEEQDGYAPLLVLFCQKCTLAQLSVTVRPDLLYSYYRYVTSTSQTMRQHFDWLSALLQSEKGSILEIGSNDGLFLDYLKDIGFRVVGCDPAANLCNIASKRGHICVPAVFNSQSSMKCLEASHGERFDAIAARHVFCHVDDWMDFFRGLGAVSHRETLICIEVPYVADMMDRLEFDSIYHEHTSYLTINAMRVLLNRTPFHLHRVIRSDIHGGSLVILIRHNDSIHPRCSIDIKENITRQQWELFDDQCRAKIQRLRRMVHDLIVEGKTITGYGASAKCTVWCNACKFTQKELKFVTDTTGYKQGRKVPGTDIPIVDEIEFSEERPDFAVMFAWNYQQEIMAKESKFLGNGGKFIVPIGEIWVKG